MPDTVLLQDPSEIESVLDSEKKAEYYVVLDPSKDDFDQLVDRAISYGFRDPVMVNDIHIPTSSYSFESFNADKPYMCMHLGGEKNKDVPDHIRAQVDFCLRHYARQPICQHSLQIDRKSLDFLFYHTRHHRHESGTNAAQTGKKKPKQREISGKFKISYSPTSDDKSTLHVSVDIESTKVGENESASYHESIGSFHTHPYDAYKRHEVCVAFPSGDDYATTIFLYATGMGAFHVLSSIEGIYLITMKPSFVKRYKPNQVFRNLKKWEKYVFDRYDIGYPGCSVDRDNKVFWKRYIAKYLKKIDKKKVFRVQFKSWEHAHEPFLLEYRPVRKNCPISDRQIKHLHRLLPSKK
jgi:hypothetical protein